MKIWVLAKYGREAHDMISAHHTAEAAMSAAPVTGEWEHSPYLIDLDYWLLPIGRAGGYDGYIVEPVELHR